MDAKGIVQVRLLNKDTLEVEYDVTQENTITNLWRTSKVARDDNPILGDEIVISETDQPSYSDFPWMQSPIAGYTPAGATSPQIFYSTQSTPTYTQWSKRFDPPSAGQTRTIRQVGLSNTSSGPTFGLVLNAYVYLSTPCTQTDSQILDVVYRVQYLSTSGTSIGLSTTQSYINDYAERATYGGAINPSEVLHSPLQLTYTPAQNKYEFIRSYTYPFGADGTIIYSGISITRLQGYAGVGYSAEEADRTDLKRYLIREGTTNAKIGHILATEFYMLGNNGVITGWKNINTPSGSNIQPIHSHASATFSAPSPTPFLDNTPATGTGTLAGSGTWTHPDYPEQYLLKMTATGDVGVSQYQMWKRNILGYAGPSYAQHHASLVQLSRVGGSSALPIPGGHGLNLSPQSRTYVAGTRGLRQTLIDHTQMITADDTGITVHTITNGEYLNFDSTTTPALPVTQVQQVSVSSLTGEIWVACALTGLWKISADRLSVTHITVLAHSVPSDIAYGVSIGRLGRVWAMFDGGLASSVDGGTTWVTHGTFSFVGITDTNWNTVSYIKADPEHLDDRLAIIRKNDAVSLTTTYLVWWDLTSGISVPVTGDNVTITHARYNTPHIRVSQQGGLWGMANEPWNYLSVLTYGSDVVQLLSAYGTQAVPCVAFERDSTGQMCYLLITDSSTSSHTVRLIDSSLALVTQATCSTGSEEDMFASAQTTPLAMYMGGGIFITHTTTTFYSDYHAYKIGTIVDTLNSPVGPFEYLVWEKYGWNGSGWEMNHTGSKPTHNTPEALMNGINITFNDGTTGTSFMDTEYYTFGVVDGILKDNSISYSTAVSTYPFTTKLGTSFEGVIQTCPSVGTVTWKHASEGLTINPDQSIVNTTAYCNYGLAAISNNRVFGDFSIVGTIDPMSGSTRYVSIGISPNRGITSDVEANWTAGTGGYVDMLSQFSFDISNDTIYCTIGQARYNSLPISAPGTTWEISRIGGTIYFSIDGNVQYTTASTDYSFCVRVTYGTQYSFAPYSAFHTIPPITVVSSGTGYFVAAGQSVDSSGSFDPNFIALDRDPTTYDISINGVPVAAKLQGGTVAPAAGEVSVCGATGEFLFNAADVGKTVTGSYVYVTK